MIEDVIAQSRRDAGGARAGVGRRACARAGPPVVGFSPAMAEADRAIKDFLYPRMYRHARIMRIMGDAEGVVRDLFAHYMERRATCRRNGGARCRPTGPRARRIADFIAGMTDRYAMVEHARLFGETPELR